MRSNQGLAAELADLNERIPDVIESLRGDRLPWKERIEFADTVSQLGKDFGDLARRLRMSAFQDGSLPPDHQI